MSSFLSKLFVCCTLLALGCQSKSVVEEVPKAFFTPQPKVVAEQTIKTLDIGEKAPNFKLPGTDGQFHQLSDYQSTKVLVIVFTCNHCPTAQAYEDRLIAVAQAYDKQEVQVIAISPTSPLALLEEECGYTDLQDDFEDMIQRAADKQFPFTYLYDGDDQAVSIQYGPTATPHAFVFDEKRTLQYRGRLDGLERPEKGRKADDLRQAIDEIRKGEKVNQPITKTFGCSIKWSWKNEWAEKGDAAWAKEAVLLEKIDLEGINTLLKNDISKKLRLINVWATWCGPCIVEYPELVKIHRMYGARSFEFVSISADKIKEEAAVLEFLKNKHSAIQNYIFSGEDVYTLVEAVDPEWDGTLPYTLLIEPNGKIVYAEQGIIDATKLKQKIVDHPLIGRYF